MAARRKSAVWEYFNIRATDNSKVSCTIYEAVVSRGGKDSKNFNASNMCHHLECKHPDSVVALK